MGEQYQLLDSYKFATIPVGWARNAVRRAILKSPEGFYSVQQSTQARQRAFIKAANIGFFYPILTTIAHGYDGKYLMIHGACVSVGCYAMTDSGIDEIFPGFVTAALVFGQPSVQVVFIRSG